MLSGSKNTFPLKQPKLCQQDLINKTFNVGWEKSQSCVLRSFDKVVWHRGQFFISPCSCSSPTAAKKYKTVSLAINSCFFFFCFTFFFFFVYHTYSDQHWGGDKLGVQTDSDKTRLSLFKKQRPKKKTTKSKTDANKSFLEIKLGKYPKYWAFGRKIIIFFLLVLPCMTQLSNNNNNNKKHPNELHHMTLCRDTSQPRWISWRIIM